LFFCKENNLTNINFEIGVFFPEFPDCCAPKSIFNIGFVHKLPGRHLGTEKITKQLWFLVSFSHFSKIPYWFLVFIPHFPRFHIGFWGMTQKFNDSTSDFVR